MIQPRQRPARNPVPEPPRKTARRRQLRTRRARYVSVMRLGAVLTIVVGLIMSYLALMGNLTSLNYSIERATRDRATLQEQTLRLDDRIAHLESRERLAELAIKMGMQEPHVYAVVDPAETTASVDKHHRSGGIALLGSVADWFRAP